MVWSPGSRRVPRRATQFQSWSWRLLRVALRVALRSRKHGVGFGTISWVQPTAESECEYPARNWGFNLYERLPKGGTDPLDHLKDVPVW